jgi:hypothetical protein
MVPSTPGAEDEISEGVHPEKFGHDLAGVTRPSGFGSDEPPKGLKTGRLFHFFRML